MHYECYFFNILKWSDYCRASDCWRARAIDAYVFRLAHNSQCVCASLARHKNRDLVSILGLSVPPNHTKHMQPHNGVPKTAPNASALQSIAVCDWLTVKHNNQSTNIYQFYLANAKLSTRLESSVLPKTRRCHRRKSPNKVVKNSDSWLCQQCFPRIKRLGE